MTYGITDTGFVIKDFNAIKSEMIIEAKALLGASLDVRETNPTIIMFNLMASREQQMWNILNDFYSNVFIVSANGVALDTLGVDRGLQRLAATIASGFLQVNGTVSTTVSNGDRFSTSGDSSVFFTANQTSQIGLTTEQFPTGVVEVLSDEYDSTNQDTDQLLGDTTILEVAQSFKGDGGVISGAVYYLRYTTAAPTGNMNAVIYAHSGTYGTSSIPTGSALATSDTLDANAVLGASYAEIEFTFTGGQKILLEKDVDYTIVLTTTVSHAANSIDVGTDTSAPTHGGNFSTNTASTWTPVSGEDAIFKVNTEGTRTLLSEAYGSFDGNNWVTVVVDGTQYTEIADPTPSLPSVTEFWVDYENPISTVYLSGEKPGVVVSITYFDATISQMTITIQGEQAGSEYNVGVNTIDTVVSAISGIDTVTNATALTGGTDVETDASFRSRLIAAPIATWTEADIESLVENITGVRGAEVSDGEMIDVLTLTGQTAESTWWKNTISATSLTILRVTFFDDSTDTNYDLIEVAPGTVDAGEYTLDTGSGATDVLEYRGPNGTGDLQTDDTLTVTFIDSTVGSGIFRVRVIPTSPPMTVALTDTISSTVKSNKPPGVSFFIDEPYFNTIALTIDIDPDTGYLEADLDADIKTAITPYFEGLAIGEVLRHAKIIDIVMGITGVLDVTNVLYQSEAETINKGVEQGTDTGQQTIVDNANFTSITDNDSVVYTKATDFQVTTGNIDWSISAVGGTVVYKCYEGAAFPDTPGNSLDVFQGSADATNEFLIGNTTTQFNMVEISATTTMDADVTGTWKYWNGASYVALSNVEDGTNDWNFASGDVYITFTMPTDWVTTTEDTISAYWIKYEVDTYTSTTNDTMDVAPVDYREPANGVVYTLTYDIVNNDNVTPLTGTITGEGTVTIQ